MSSSLNNVAPTDALEQLAAALAERRAVEIAAENARRHHQTAVYTQWAAVEPVLSLAITEVNVVLAEYGFPCITCAPASIKDYVLESYLIGRGARCQLEGIRGGSIDVVVTDDGSSGWRVVVGGEHRWDEGWIVPLEGISVKSLRNALAWAARWRILEEPAS